MKNIKRILALLLITAIALTCLVSCEKTPEELVKAADEALLKRAYTVDIDMDFSSDNPEMNEAFKSMNDMDIEMAVNGDDMKLDMDLSMSVMGISMAMNSSYVMIDNTLYLKMAVSSGGYSQNIKNKATLTEENIADFKEDAGVAYDVSSLDFENISMELVEDSFIITCDGIKADATEKLTDMISDQLEGSNAECAIENVKLVIEIEEGKYDTTTLSCDYKITVEGETYSVHMNSEMEYDYAELDEPIVISAPTDASDYEEVTYEELMGNK